MRKILFLIVILLIIPVVQGRKAVFVSKYPPKGMDVNTLDYYEHILGDETFSDIEVIQDVKIEDDPDAWKETYEDADLIFVIFLSDQMFTSSRDIFCKNLGMILTKKKGIIFAGNSSLADGVSVGCPYTSYFNLATYSDNTKLRSSSVKIVEEHEITDGYEVNENYNLAVEDMISTIVNPEDGIVLGTTHGDPDGIGSSPESDYPFLMIWEGVGYRAAVWGINTSALTDCEDCLDWKLFDQLLEWASDTDEIGFEIKTDKETYYPEERIHIDLEFPANVSSVSGYIVYPNNVNYSLYFTGSGKEWSGVYLLEEEDPVGDYILNIIADGVKETKTVSLEPFGLDLEINNQTKEVEIEIDVTDKGGNILNDVNVSLEITAPSGLKKNYFFENNGSIDINYTVSESGEYTVYVSAIDKYKRSSSITQYFSYFFGINITFIPKNVTEIVHKAINLTETVTVKNNNNRTITNTRILKSGEIKDWIELGNETLGDIEANGYDFLKFNLNIPDEEVGNYTGNIKLFFDGVEFVLPIFVRMKYLGNLSVSPTSWEGWIPIGQSETIEFLLENSGKGEVIIESVTVTGNLGDLADIIKKPDIVEPGMNKTMKIKITGNVTMTDLTKEINGDVEIMTDQGLYYPPISLDVTFVQNMIERVDLLSPDLSELEENITTLEKSADVSELRDDLEGIKSDLDDVKTLYNQGDYESAVTKFEPVESDIDDLRSNIVQKQIEVEEKRRRSTMAIIILIIAVIAGVIIWLAFKKVQKKKEYIWLYKKWK